MPHRDAVSRPRDRHSGTRNQFSRGEWGAAKYGERPKVWFVLAIANLVSRRTIG